MPLYEYKCQSCGKIFEVRQKFSDEALKLHEACGGELERLISAPGLQFKGSGWYVTDYARGNGKRGGASSSDSKEAAKPDSGATSKPVETAAKSTTESKKS